jgi:hypothetical protein
MSTTPNRAKGRRTLLLIALVAFAPVIASYVAYYWFTPTKRVNYGELIGPVPVPAIVGVRDDGTSFDLATTRGKWVLLIASTASCDQSCRQALYATRQARTIQGRERDRVARVWLRPNGSPAAGTETATDDGALVTAFAEPTVTTRLPLSPGDATTILILDPRGNMVLRYGANPDIKKLSKDLDRLLRTSQMG